MKKLTRTGAVVLIIAATLLVYWPALRNGFVWDDTALVLRDPLIRSWRLIPEGFRHFLFLDATASEFYRPIQRLSFVFDYQVYGFDRPWGWHLTSILVHAGAAVALFFAAEGLIAALASSMPEARRRMVAFGAALLWAIHPLYTSAVTYVAGRADPLAALFGFAGLALGLIAVGVEPREDANAGSEEHPGDAAAKTAPPQPTRLWALGAAVCFLLAMLSKESGIIFVPIWLLFLAWRRETRRVLISWAIIAVVMLSAYTVLRRSSDHLPPPPARPTPVAIRPILAARAFCEYAGLLVAPVTLRMERDVSTQRLENFEETLRMARLWQYVTLAGVLLLIGFGLWFRFCFRKLPATAFALAAFAIAYLPISNLLSLNATIAEHWLYVPGAFLLLALFLTGEHFVEQSVIRGRRRPLICVGAVGLCWIALLGVRTFLRQADWKDQRTFVERTIADGGNSPRMLMNLANVEFAGGNQAVAVSLYREALRRAPDMSIIWFGYASVLLRAHDFPAAREALDKAAKSEFLAADICLMRAGLENAASGSDPGELLRQSVALAPKNWGIRQKYIEYLHDSGQPQAALRELQGFLKDYDFRAESWRLFATMLEEQHQPKLAAEAYREAAARDVHDEDSRAKAAKEATNPGSALVPSADPPVRLGPASRRNELIPDLLRRNVSGIGLGLGCGSVVAQASCPATAGGQ